MDTTATEVGMLGQDEGAETPEQIEAEIEQTRAELSETIDAIQAKLSPQAIKEQAMDTVREATEHAVQTARDNTIGRAEDIVYDIRDTATGVGYSMIDTIKENPIPAALAALGLGWLFMEGRGQSTPRRSSYSSRSDFRDRRRDYYSPSREYGDYRYADRDRWEERDQGMLGEAQDRAKGLARDARRAAGDAWDRVEDFGGDLPRGSVETIRENPIPALLAAASVGWLLMEGRSSGKSESRARNEQYRYRQGASAYDYGAYDREQGQGFVSGAQERAGEMAGQAQQKAGQVAGQARDAASSAVDQAQQLGHEAKEKVGQVADQARDVAGSAIDRVEDLGSEARYRLERVPTRLEEMLEDNPLMVGAAALALGAAIGVALPSTQRERELMGPARERLMEKAQDTAEETLQKVQTVAQETTQAVQQELQDRGIVDQVKGVAKSTVEAVKSAADEAKQTAQEGAKSQGLTSGQSGTGSSSGGSSGGNSGSQANTTKQPTTETKTGTTQGSQGGF